MKPFLSSLFFLLFLGLSFAQKNQQLDKFLVSSIYEDLKSELITTDVLHLMHNW